MEKNLIIQCKECENISKLYKFLNVDTLMFDVYDYKKELGEKWEKVTPSNYFFRLVSKDKIEEFITELQRL